MQERLARIVGDLDQQGSAVESREHFGQRRREACVVDDRRGARVVQQVRELVGHVAVVDVERCGACRVAAEVGLEKLGAVEHVQADEVLSGFGAHEAVALAVEADAVGAEHVREAASPVGQRLEGRHPPAPADGRPVGDGSGDGVERRPDVVVHQGILGVLSTTCFAEDSFDGRDDDFGLDDLDEVRRLRDLLLCTEARGKRTLMRLPHLFGFV